MGECIAVMNAGSSSIKFALYRAEHDPELIFRGEVEKIGISPRLSVKDASGQALVQREMAPEGFDHQAATNLIFDTVIGLTQGERVRAVGHRVVHGGTDYSAPVVMTPAILASLMQLTPLAPLHQPHNLAAIRAISEAAPHIAQIACFDTSFHRAQPHLAQLFALPRKYTDSGIRRYGFHGLSYEYVVEELQRTAPGLADGKLVIAHLGNGASLCAVDRGRGIASTMGFTAVDGLMMGTRCGTIDPGALLYLMDEHGMNARDIEDLIYRCSGLLGVSGISSDMRSLRASNDPAAREAIDLFVYRVVREIGSLVAALGGLDGLIFTGGIGAHDRATRSEIVAQSGWLGMRLDEPRNATGNGRISSSESAVEIRIVQTDEERMVARQTASLLTEAVEAH
jgi:acetate kinase